MEVIEYSKISITAKFVAYLREYSDIPFAQDVSTYIRAEDALQTIAARLQGENDSLSKQNEMLDESKLIAPLLEARYKSIVQLILKTNIKQVLEVASGFSLRGLAMTQDPDLSYVESDLVQINNEKHKLIGALRQKYQLKDLGNHRVVAANALDYSDLEAATNSLNRSEPLVVVNEGLIPYLSATEMARLADNVRELLSKFAGGVWITPDFITKTVADDVSENRKRFRNAINDTTERQLHGAAFESDAAIDEFTREHGFSGEVFDQAALVTLVSPERLGLSSSIVESLRPHMRVWLLWLI